MAAATATQQLFTRSKGAEPTAQPVRPGMPSRPATARPRSEMLQQAVTALYDPQRADELTAAP